MNRTCWDQEMVVLPGWELVHIFFGPEGMVICLSHLQFPDHGLPVAKSLKTEVYTAIVAGIE